MTRKIKDARDVASNELIYFKGHAQATYMSDGSTVEDNVLNKQDILVSGTNLKTVNSQSLLGKGDISFAKYYVTNTKTSIALKPNIYYKQTNTPSSLTITLEDATRTDILNEYFIEFTCASGGTTVSLPSTIK